MPIISEWGGYTFDGMSGKPDKSRAKRSRFDFERPCFNKSYTAGPNSKKQKKSDNDSDSSSSNGDEDFADIMNLLGKKPKASNDNFYSMNNNIYFQDEISLETADYLKKELREMEEHLLQVASKYSMDAPPIRLHITSGGGSVIAAYSIIDCMGELKVPVHTIVDGYAASAATLISVHGAKRFIKKNASMLIHQVRSGMWGKMAELEDDYKNIKKTHERIKDIYEQKTNLKRNDLVKILKHDLDWDAEECLERGLVDEII
ncbi:Clp protease ClpP [bacterium]|nr:Clp protease ClpP [bacterium]